MLLSVQTGITTWCCIHSLRHCRFTVLTKESLVLLQSVTENPHREETAGLTDVRALASFVYFSSLWRHTPAGLANMSTPCAVY